MSETLKEHLDGYDEVLATLEKQKSECEQEMRENDYTKLVLDNINLQINTIEKAREDCETHIAKLKELEEKMESVGL